jgi:hypothetical protein
MNSHNRKNIPVGLSVCLSVTESLAVIRDLWGLDALGNRVSVYVWRFQILLWQSVQFTDNNTHNSIHDVMGVTAEINAARPRFQYIVSDQLC